MYEMFPIQDTDFQRREIFDLLSPKLQALLSKTHKELADERKYREMVNKPFEYEELEKVDVTKVYSFVGNDSDHIFACWTVEKDDYLYKLYINSSSKVENGMIVDQIKEFFFTGLGGYGDIVPDVEEIEYFTKVAYDEDIPIKKGFDFILYSMDEIDTSDVEVKIYYSIADVYMMYASRCRDLYLDEEKYALRATLEYYEELMSYILLEEFPEEIDGEIFMAKYYLESVPRWR